MVSKDILQKLDNVTVNIVGLRTDINFIPSSEIVLIVSKAMQDLSPILSWSVRECLEEISDASLGS